MGDAEWPQLLKSSDILCQCGDLRSGPWSYHDGHPRLCEVTIAVTIFAVAILCTIFGDDSPNPNHHLRARSQRGHYNIYPGR